MRSSLLVAAVLLWLAVVLVAGPSLLGPSTTGDVPVEDGTDPEMVRPTGGESGFWPYLNSRQVFERRSPINVVVIGDVRTVVRLLTGTSGGEWVETDDEQAEADPGTFSIGAANDSNDTDRADRIEIDSTTIQWGRTTGASRYAYVDPGEGEDGRWIEETVQLHDGTYYGHRYHIRLYESPTPGEPWVAMQTHSEHFDWFTLRHRVQGSQAAQTRLEADLMGHPRIDEREDVRRIYLANRNGADADGWATLVDLLGAAAAGLALGLSTGGVRQRLAGRVDDRLTDSDWRRIEAARDRFDPRHVILAGTIVALVLGVRTGGITLERMGLFSMHAIAVVLYPVVALGLPIATYAVASGLERRLDAAVVASVALAVAIRTDYGLLGVESLPVEVIGQRMLLVVALGLLAGGATRRITRWNGMTIAGATLWLLVLVGTLLGVL